MNILMMTNTYKPILGGLEKSIESFTNELRALGHRVIIVAPEFEGMEKEKDLIRIPAIQNFKDTGFSVQLPIPTGLVESWGDFRPDIVHSHHPFLVGDTALRIASKYNAPLVFTHHTLYEENTHYVPVDQEPLKRFVIELSTGYANLADKVFAPSGSVMKMIRERGVETSIEVIPTGIYVDNFKRGAGKAFRKKQKIPANAFVAGHVGRLAPEKNLEFVAQAVALFLKKNPKAHFLIGGSGPSEDAIKEIMRKEGVEDRLHLAGVVKGKDLVATYHAMDVFVFASQSETQGLVLTEAMAASIPVVAVDAPGVRDVVKDGVNGRLLAKQDADEFAQALEEMSKRSATAVKKMKEAARETAEGLSMKHSLDKVLKSYTSLIIQGFVRRGSEKTPFAATVRVIESQWGLMKNFTKATGAMILGTSETPEKENKPDAKEEVALENDSDKKGDVVSPVKKLQSEKGRIGWIILWLLGVPIPILFILFLIRGCN